MKTYKNITLGDLSSRYPNGTKATDEARALIQGLCAVKVEQRLSCLHGNASDVMAHPWFEGCDWDGLINLTQEPPWRPRLAAYDDTQYFDDVAQNEWLEGPVCTPLPPELEQLWQGLQKEYSSESGDSKDQMDHLNHATNSPNESVPL